MKKNIETILLLAALATVFVSCSAQRKLSKIRSGASQANIQLPARRTYVPEIRNISEMKRDTLKVTDPDGREFIIMKAVRDDETGEMVATEQITAAMVTARFRNTAERHGKVDLEFQVIVPETMRDTKWQLRMHPDMYILQDSLRLDDVVITGDQYRKAQLRGYQQYQRFIESIVTDSSAFVDKRNLQIWIERNLPGIHAFRNDTTFVSDEEFSSFFGVTEQEAVEHYTNQFAKRRNQRRWENRDRMWNRYVKSPIVTDGIRLDTVIIGSNGDFIYNYVQTINTRKGLRKADIVLSGEIYEQERQIYTMPRSEPLTFYISSVAAFVDNTERYKTKVLSRKVAADVTADIVFGEGKWDIDEDLENNEHEIGLIKDNLRALLRNEEFDLDSITIISHASPEGAEVVNNQLCLKRAQSASGYFDRFVTRIRDSIRREEGFLITLGEDMSEDRMKASSGGPAGIRFKSRSGGENWQLLDRLVERDTVLTDAEKEDYLLVKESECTFDAREKELSGKPYYSRLRGVLYPRLRSVRFDFALHRKGMVKDTVHTTELDTIYARGVQCIRDRDFEAAITILRPYQDYNTAVAYVAMDYNQSAMAILKDLEKTPQVNYLQAILYSRFGDEQNAVQSYVHSCHQDASFINRGNLDPEISTLIRKYNLNNQTE